MAAGRFRVSPSFILFVLLEPFGLLTLLSYLTFIMSQLSEHDYSILECLLNHTWANERWGEQLPRRIPLDTLGSMLLEYLPHHPTEASSRLRSAQHMLDLF